MDYQPQLPQPAPVPAQPAHSFVDRIIGAVKLSRPIYDEVRRDPSAMMQAAGIVAMTGLLSGISQFAEVRGDTIDIGGDNTYEVTNSFFGPLVSGIGVAVLSLVVWVLSAVLFRFVATKLLNSPETNIQWQEVARPLGFASAPSLLLILTPIPILGFFVGSIVGIWTFVAQLVAMSETFRVSKWRAFSIMLVAALALVIVISMVVCACILAALAIA
jgi:uncharacterized membrane protein